jgi:hypothetical protein
MRPGSGASTCPECGVAVPHHHVKHDSRYYPRLVVLVENDHE